MRQYFRNSAMVWSCIVGILAISDTIDILILGYGESAWSPLRNMMSRLLQAAFVALVLAPILGVIVLKTGRSRPNLATWISFISGVTLGLYLLGWTITVNHYGFSPSVLQLFLGLLIIPVLLGTVAALVARAFAASGRETGG